VVEASVTWSPTGRTTFTGVLARTIEDPAAVGTGGYVYTRARVVVDHELLRNVLLQGYGGFESAKYLEAGGTQTNATFGAGIRWLLNRQLQLALDYSFARQDSPDSYATLAPFAASGAGLPSASYTRNLVLLTVRIAL
jgi:hypothetical protein